MFNPLEQSEVLRALGATMRQAARTDAAGDGLAQAQLLAGASVARLMAAEVGPVQLIEREFEAAMAAVLEPIASAAQGRDAELCRAWLDAVSRGDRLAADELLGAIVRLDRPGAPSQEIELARRAKSLLRTHIDEEAATYAKESSR